MPSRESRTHVFPSENPVILIPFRTSRDFPTSLKPWPGAFEFAKMSCRLGNWENLVEGIRNMICIMNNV